MQTVTVDLASYKRETALMTEMAKRVIELEAAGAVLLNAVRGDGAVTAEQVNEAAAVLRKGK